MSSGTAVQPPHVSEQAGASRLATVQERLLVIYDGECGFCHRSIRWLIRRDRKDRMRFVASSDPVVADLLAKHGFQTITTDGCSQTGRPESSSPDFAGSDSRSPDTILVFRHLGSPIEELLVRSNAVLACLRVLPEPWPLLAAIARLIPRRFRESVYRLIARWRYQIAGHSASCPIPAAEERSRFL